MKIRDLEVDDFQKRFAECISALGETNFEGREWLGIHFVEVRKRMFIRTFVAIDENDDSVIGTASLVFEPKLLYGARWAARIEDVAVRKDQQGKGVGRALVNHCVEVAKDKQGLYKIILHCSQNNVKFYEKLGFYQSDNFLMRIDVEEKEVDESLTEGNLIKKMINGDLDAVIKIRDLMSRQNKGFVVYRIDHALKSYAKEPEKLLDFVITYVFNACPKCGSQKTSIKNFDPVWRDGDITCNDCGTYVRMYDAS